MSQAAAKREAEHAPTFAPLPNFFLIGTAKSATSSIAAYLRDHPEVCFCEVDEPNFFAFDHAYQRGLARYRQRYDHYRGEPVIGEKSWRYSCAGTYPKALERMVADIGTFKAVYVARDPLPRAISMWRELRDSGQDRVPAEIDRALTSPGVILDSCLYATQISHIERAVGAENLLVLLFEDLNAAPEAFYDQLCDFLGIAHHEIGGFPHTNASRAKRSDGRMLAALRQAGLGSVARTLAPEPVRSFVRAHLKRSIIDEAPSAVARRIFLDLVGEDARATLDRLGRAHHVWTLEE